MTDEQADKLAAAIHDLAKEIAWRVAADHAGDHENASIRSELEAQTALATMLKALP